MKLTAHLDLSMVAHETSDEVSVMLDLAAPPAPAPSEGRPPAALQVVLDRSGSMAGERLAGAVDALERLVARLDPTDAFGVVAFDDQAQVVVPAGPLHDREGVVARLRAITPGGSTDLSSGYLRGLQELRRATAGSGSAGSGRSGRGGTLLVVSDGHVNGGIQDPVRFAEVTRAAGSEGVVTSTLGLGLGYDERLLAAIATAGSGNHHFAEGRDQALALIATEVEHLLAKSVQAASLTVRMSPHVAMLQLYNDLPAQQVDESTVMVELGDLYAEETRRLLLRLAVPALPGLGLAEVARLELRYVELPGLVEQVVTLPVTVNVVPGDQAAGRVPDPTVRSELFFQRAQQAKRRASEALLENRSDVAKAHLDRALSDLDEAQACGAPPEVLGDLAREDADVHRLLEEIELGGVGRTSKLLAQSVHEQTRKRGRRRPERDRDSS